MTLVFLFFLGLTTGFVGTNTGGSAFLTVPIMIWLGIAPQSAIATARVASVGTMVAGLRQFHKQGKIDYKLALPAAVFGLIGAVLGASLLLHTNTDALHKIIGGLTLLMVALSFVKKPSTSSRPPSKLMRSIGYILFILIGMIGGFFGGQAKLATYIFILIFDKTVSESVGTRKISGLVISVASLIIYGVNDIVNWKFGFALIFGTLLGATAGAKYALKKGDVWMERLLNIVVVLLALKLIFFSV